MRAEQRLKQSQTLRLSPAQLQLMKLLELPSIDLNQRINEELVANPALEEGIADPRKDDSGENIEDGDGNEEESLSEQEQERDTDMQESESTYEEEDSGEGHNNDWIGTNYTGGQSLHDALKEQVYQTRMDKHERHIAKWVLGNIDEDGFLRRTTEQLIDDYAFQEGENVPEEEMENIVSQIKGFDPAGVGARDLQECLLLQLKRKGYSQAVSNAIRIVHVAWEDFCMRHFQRVQEQLEMTEEEMREANNVILHLNRKPANAFEGNTREDQHRQTIIPDFQVKNEDGELIMTLNHGNIPPLRVSETYEQMLREESDKTGKGNKEAAHVIRDYIDNAQTFIQALKQRKKTLYDVMSVIVGMQRSFFLSGDVTSLRPMKMRDVSDRTGYDVSTISRVSNSKWVQTDFGVFPLREFFSEGMENAEGDEISNREIKKILKDEIDREDKQNPKVDDELVEALAAHGYKVARRTVAKYRDMLGIPVARLRKKM